MDLGEEVVYVDGGDPEALLGAVERHRAVRLYCIPAVWRRIMDAGPERFDTSSLRQADTGTSAITVELLGQVHQAFPQTTTTVTYGSTEAGVVCQLWPEDVLRKPGSVGPPVPGVFLRLDEGELIVRNPWLTSGYFRDPEATASSLEDGWYRTGELAEIDEDGHCLIVGRVKDVIRTGGETVSPVEVDLVLSEHPDVADVATSGVPDDEWGEIVTAFVVCAPAPLSTWSCSGPTVRAGWPATSTRGDLCGLTRSPAPRRQARSSAGARRARCGLRWPPGLAEGRVLKPAGLTDRMPGNHRSKDLGGSAVLPAGRRGAWGEHRGGSRDGGDRRSLRRPACRPEGGRPVHHRAGRVRRRHRRPGHAARGLRPQ